MWETRWSFRKSRDIGRGFKAVLCGSPRTTSGVGIIVSERFRVSIVSVERFDDRLMKIVVAAKERLYHFFSAYAPQTDCSDQAKEESAGADAHSQSSASVKSMRGSLMQGWHREATELVRKSRNVSRTRVATLNVGTLTGP
ncbi:unnamed protein product [Heligmosomoides polygyrus]|uniref:Cyclic nucleotide-binding domain-containing protein n=1 Tax=Heligmosomoides polygyrus TaxID=6339 RepID=A0A183FV19_HELPZ|nr:unnamed protein product [Heligmosomoides polygyrus]